MLKKKVKKEEGRRRKNKSKKKEQNEEGRQVIKNVFHPKMLILWILSNPRTSSSEKQTYPRPNLQQTPK